MSLHVTMTTDSSFLQHTCVCMQALTMTSLLMPQTCVRVCVCVCARAFVRTKDRQPSRNSTAFRNKDVCLFLQHTYV